jgi:rod shape-determining protein MreC
MRSLFLLFKRFQVLLLFLFLEGVSLALIFQHNHYQNAVFYNSANKYAGSVLNVTSSVEGYFNLNSVNKRLTQENQKLHAEIEQLRQLSYHKNHKVNLDSSLLRQYEFTVARVVNNTTHRSKNYITINKGLKDGLRPGMGVIGPNGIIGKIRHCSKNYSSIISLLHSDLIVSAVIKKNDAIGRIKWEGGSYRTAKLLEISNHLKIVKGDTVLTSGYNKTFPPGTMIGTIQKLTTKSQTYYDIDVLLSTSFNQLTYVYVVTNELQIEQEAIETDSLTLNP